MFFFSESQVENYSFLQAFVSVSIVNPMVHYTKPLQQKLYYCRVSFKYRQKLPDTFLLEMRNK